MKYIVPRLILLLLFAVPLSARSGPPVITLEIRDHLFFPDTIEIPANQKVKLLVINRDDTAEEFESFELNREKIIPGGAKAIIFIGPLAPGSTRFLANFSRKRPRER